MKLYIPLVLVCLSGCGSNLTPAAPVATPLITGKKVRSAAYIKQHLRIYKTIYDTRTITDADLKWVLSEFNKDPSVTSRLSTMAYLQMIKATPHQHLVITQAIKARVGSSDRFERQAATNTLSRLQ